MIAQQLRVAVGGALLEAAADLADEAADVDHDPPRARPGAGLPGALQRPAQQRVELAHVPERERAQERPERRGRRQPAAQQPPRAPRAARLCRRCCRRPAPSKTAAPSPCGPRRRRPDDRAAAAPGSPPAPRSPAAQRASQPARSRRPRRAARRRIRPHAVQSDRPAILHHEGNLLTQDAAAQFDRFLPAQGVVLRSRPDATPGTPRWIEARATAIPHHGTD